MKLSKLFIIMAVAILATSAIVVGAETPCSKEGEERCTNPEASLEENEDPVPTSSEKEDPNCPSRDLIIRCCGIHLDDNKNGKLDRNELETAIDSLPWYAKGILQILGSVDKMMKKCDMDGDDAISMHYDMIHNKDQCLASCFKRRAFKNSFFPDCE